MEDRRIFWELKGKVLTLCLPQHTCIHDGTNRETTGETAVWLKQLDKKNHGIEDSGYEKNGQTESGGWSEGKF